jgi:hypothetical protein
MGVIVQGFQEVHDNCVKERKRRHEMDRSLTEYNPQTEAFEAEQFEWGETEWTGEMTAEGVFSEAQEMQLAAELLEIRDEAELDRFLGDFIKKAAQTVGRVVRSPIGKAIGGVLKGVAKKALPIAGAALGGWVGGPIGAKIGSGLASAAGSALGLEAQELTQEDREFEGAKQFVRLAGEAVKNASSAPPSADPRAVAQKAVASAAQKYAPGLLSGVSGGPSTSLTPGGGRGRTGRWIRRGRNVIIVNC